MPWRRVQNYTKQQPPRVRGLLRHATYPVAYCAASLTDRAIFSYLAISPA